MKRAHRRILPKSDRLSAGPDVSEDWRDRHHEIECQMHENALRVDWISERVDDLATLVRRSCARRG